VTAVTVAPAVVATAVVVGAAVVVMVEVMALAFSLKASSSTGGTSDANVINFFSLSLMLQTNKLEFFSLSILNQKGLLGTNILIANMFTTLRCICKVLSA